VNTRRPAAGQFLQLIALSAFAVGQPLLGLLADFPGFLVAHRSAPVDVVLLALAFFAALPLALFALTRAVSLISRRAEAIAHGASVSVLTALVVSPWIGRVLVDTGVLALVASAAFGVLFALAVTHVIAVGRFAAICSVGAVVFLVQFFVDAEIRALVFQAEPPVVEAPRLRERIPIVVVIFDELPLSSLLGADGRINRGRFPTFAKLADHSTLFRNATGVASYTQQAVPSILTGRYPGTHPKLAIASEHPDNLFSLLAKDYELNVFESQMQLGDPDELPRPSLARRMRPVFDDLFIVYLHVVLPASLARDLPPVNETWKNFAGSGAAPTTSENGKRSEGDPPIESHPAFFRRFIDSIEEHPGAALHFIHSTMPHRPWRYLPSGNVYFPYRQHGMSAFRSLGGDWWQQEAYQRHLLQLQFVDRLLGELLDRLADLGLYEQSLIILTADHGVSFWPDDNARIVGLSKHPEDILGVPLLIKRPDQIRSRVDDRNVETVDILPTIADLVGVPREFGKDPEAGFAFDGCSLFDPACEERPDKVAYSADHPAPETMQELRFDKALGLRDQTLRRNLAWFGSGIHRFGPYSALAGTRVEALDVGEELAGRAIFDVESRPKFYDPNEKHVHVRVSASLELAREPESTPYIAVAMAGEIQTVVPAPVDGVQGRRVLAMIPESKLVAGAQPTLFLVGGPPEQPRIMGRISGVSASAQ
jgi:arylsulfatase A-like enzyme